MKIIKIETREKAAKGNLPDVDLDFETRYRDDVKKYIKDRFGEDFVCSIGSYATFKLKGAIKDFSKVKGLDFQKINFITKGIDNQLEYDFRDLFKYAQKNPELKRFINEYPEITHTIRYSLNQTKTASIHASAVIIVPKFRDGKNANIFNWMPTRKENGLLVGEWEGAYTDTAGFLKEDILGLNQLDKLHNINILLKRNDKKAVNWEKLRLDNENVYKLFQQGYSEDVFQFTSAGLKSYEITVGPTKFSDLVAMTALFRPGPMLINAHKDFALIKHGQKKLKYDYGLKEITESTYSLLIYQEQIMKAVVDLGGLTLSDAEQVRDCIKKFDTKRMSVYENKFIKGAIERECPVDEAKKIWEKIVGFSKYSFNLSHSVSYTLMSYWSQWAKYTHPLEFWTTSLQFADEEDIPNRISEMRKLKQGVSLKPPDVNYSEELFTCNSETNSIYWGLKKIKGLGEAVVPKIMVERNSDGRFLSYEDLKSRFAKKDVNKGHLTAMIISGAFDDVEGITDPEDRIELVKKHFSSYGESLPEKFLSPLIVKRYFWIGLQKELTGFGILDFQQMLSDNKELKKYKDKVVDSEEFLKLPDYSDCSIVGSVLFINERDSKNGKWLRVTIISNGDMIQLQVWSDIYQKYNEMLVNSIGKMLLFTDLKTKYNSFQNFVCGNSSEKTIIKEI